jgi:hypothetical protein
VTNDSDDTAAKASISEVSGCAGRVDAQVREVLGRVLAQRRNAGTAFAYVAGSAPRVRYLGLTRKFGLSVRNGHPIRVSRH